MWIIECFLNYSDSFVKSKNILIWFSFFLNTFIHNFDSLLVLCLQSLGEIFFEMFSGQTACPNFLGGQRSACLILGSFLLGLSRSLFLSLSLSLALEALSCRFGFSLNTAKNKWGGGEVMWNAPPLLGAPYKNIMSQMTFRNFASPLFPFSFVKNKFYPSCHIGGQF